MIRFGCPMCKSSLQARDQDAGAKFACPKCGQRLQIPNPPAPSKTVLGESLPAPQKTVLGTPEPEINVAVAKSAMPPLPRPAGGTTCPHCALVVQVPGELRGTWVRCPGCGGDFEVPSPYGSSPPRALQRASSVEEYEDRPRPRRRRRRRRDSSVGGMVCSVLSIIFGCIAFLFCPPLFGLAGLVLGIVGTALSDNKATGIVGIVLSVLGTVLGMILGAMMMARHY